MCIVERWLCVCLCARRGGNEVIAIAGRGAAGYFQL